MTEWFYESGGAQQGPVPEDELKAMMLSRTLGARSLVWTEGMETWSEAGSVLDWSENIGRPKTGVAVPGYAPPAHGPAQVPYPLGGLPNSGLSIASLCCGIGSLVMMLGCGLGIVAGIPAVICGHLALGQFKRGLPLAGRGMAIAGLVTGYVSIALTVAGILVFVAVYIAAESGVR